MGVLIDIQNSTCMKTSARILISCFLICLITVSAIAQDADSTTSKDEHQKKLPEKNGLRKIASGSQSRDMDLDININIDKALDQSIESTIEQSVEAVVASFENIDIHIEPFAIDLDDLNIDIDPVNIDIPDLHIDIDPVEIGDMDFNINKDFDWKSGSDENAGDQQ